MDTLLMGDAPVLLASGYDGSVFPARYIVLLRCEKPFTIAV